MFDHEKTAPSDFLSQTAKKVIAHQQAQLAENLKESQSNSQSLNHDVQTLLSMYSPDPFNTIKGSFVGEFLSRFCQPYLQPESITEIQQKLLIARKKFPQLIEMNQQLMRINQTLFSMDSESTEPTTITAKKTAIPEENIVIATFMKSTLVKRAFYKRIGTTTAIPMTYVETETSFNLDPIGNIPQN
jgi:hypothetical protein